MLPNKQIVHEHSRIQRTNQTQTTPKPRSLFVFVRDVREQPTTSTNKFYCIKFVRNWTLPSFINKPECLNGCFVIAFLDRADFNQITQLKTKRISYKEETNSYDFY